MSATTKMFFVIKIYGQSRHLTIKLLTVLTLFTYLVTLDHMEKKDEESLYKKTHTIMMYFC